MVLKGSPAHLIAHVQNLGHLRVRDHFNLSPIDPLYSIDESKDMRHVMCLNVYATWSLVAVENREDHKRLLLVEEINCFLK